VDSREFFFAVAVSGGMSREMLTELAARALERAGSSSDGAAALGESLHAAVSRGGSAGEILVRFLSAARRLHIVVSSRSGEIWQATREIP
jgi:hypothetical protein